ncbi:O-antigen ligase family protein [Candidatus Magnetominusculus dajiuhuensis]|uniref:O-antigen ligase family protein n=1 Tax=Candidatus Magnetominusculus dajiuhuensis TaxID=3137712 RepID=UPI003B433483
MRPGIKMPLLTSESNQHSGSPKNRVSGLSMLSKRMLDNLSLVFITANILLLVPDLIYCGKLTIIIAVGAPLLFCLAVFTSLLSLERVLVIFVLAFPLLGFQPYDRHSLAFEYMAALATFSMHVMRMRRGLRQSETPVNGALSGLLVCYILLSVFSLLMLPISRIINDAIVMKLNFTSRMFSIFPTEFNYSLAGVDRLILFSLFAFEFAKAGKLIRHGRTIFLALFWGTVYSAFIGLLDFYNVLSLNWYRLAERSDVVNAFFSNRGWLAHYINITVPFVILAFIKKGRHIAATMGLFGILIVIEVALFLSGARAGWVTYPIVLILCWVAFISLSQEQKHFSFSLRTLIKAVLLMPITIAVSIAFIVYLSPIIEERGHKPPNIQQNDPNVQQNDPNSMQKIITTMDEQASATIKRSLDTGSRTSTWNDGIHVGMESPIVGLGYDSYGWQAKNLDKIVHSDFKKGTILGTMDTPHNTLIQVFVSGGIIGVILWCLLIAYIIAVCLADAVKNKNYLSLAVAISMVSAHIHGFFQDLQYVPMIWMVIFLEIGYAMSLETALLPQRLNNVVRKFIVCAFIAVTATIPIYLHLSSYRFIKDKYGVNTYMPDEDQHRYGFYSSEIIGGSRYWYSGGDAYMDVKGDNVEIPFLCPHLDADKKPVTATISIDGKPIDLLIFSKPGKLTRTYHVGAGTHRVGIKVSRLWNPIMAKVSQDLRNLGLAVGEVRCWK